MLIFSGGEWVRHCSQLVIELFEFDSQWRAFWVDDGVNCLLNLSQLVCQFALSFAQLLDQRAIFGGRRQPSVSAIEWRQQRIATRNNPAA